jgi:hypothetical protein
MATRLIRPGLALIAIGVLLFLLYGPGFVGYDGAYALDWGRSIAHGEAPNLETGSSPTPHPLVNAVTVVLAVFGDSAREVFMALSLIAFAALAVAAFAFGRALFGTAAGVLFALIVVTRDGWVNAYDQALPDLAFMAFLLGAGAAEARRPDEPRRVLVLLGVAGLIRPEAWLLGGVYALWKGWPRPARERLWLLAGAAAPGVVWLLCDLLLTGDPLHSLHGTSAAAERIGRPRELGTAIQAGPDYLLATLHPAVLWLGFAGTIAGLVFLYRESRVPAVVLALGLLGFGVLGVAGLPLLERYLYLPSLALALFAAVAVFGWTRLEPSRARTIWRAAGAVGACVLVLGAVTDDRDELRRLDTLTDERRRLEASLHDAIDTTRPELDACPPIAVPDQLMVPITAFWIGGDPDEDVRSSRVSRVVNGSLITRPPNARRPWVLDPRSDRRRVPQVPDRLSPVGGTSAWRIYSSC